MGLFDCVVSRLVASLEGYRSAVTLNYLGERQTMKRLADELKAILESCGHTVVIVGNPPRKVLPSAWMKVNIRSERQGT